MSIKFIVQPQRSNGVGYTDCDDKIATSYAVMKITTTSRRGRNYRHFKTLSRHQTRNEAETRCESHSLGQAGPLRRYVLGRRMNRE